MAASVTVKDLDRLVSDLFDKRAKIEEVESIVSGMKAEAMELEQKAVGYLKELERDDYKTERGSIRIRQIWSVKLPPTPEEKAKLFDWMRKQGIYDKYATVHATSLKSLVLEEREAWIRNGGDPVTFSIPGVPEPTLYEALGVQKSRTTTEGDS